eukprot:3059488-Rhodomonas_salina.2
MQTHAVEACKPERTRACQNMTLACRAWVVQVLRAIASSLSAMEQVAEKTFIDALQHFSRTKVRFTVERSPIHVDISLVGLCTPITDGAVSGGVGAGAGCDWANDFEACDRAPHSRLSAIDVRVRAKRGSVQALGWPHDL